MQRALTGYLNGCTEIKPYLDKAIIGLEHLKNTYKEQGKDNTFNEIEKIISYVDQNFQKKEKFNKLTENRWLHLNRLEASYIESGNEKIGVESFYEGVGYYKDRIAQFVILERESLNPTCPLHPCYD